MTVGWSKVRDGGGVAYRMVSDKVTLCTPQVQAVISLGCFSTSYCAHIPPPISVSEAAAPPIRMMACKVDLYSVIICIQ